MPNSLITAPERVGDGPQAVQLHVFTNVAPKPIFGSDSWFKPQHVTMEEAKEQGLTVWPKWAPIVIAVVTALLTSGFNYGVITTRLGSVQTQIDQQGQSIRAIEASREARRDVYEKRIENIESGQAAIFEAMKEHSNQLNRIEDKLDKR